MIRPCIAVLVSLGLAACTLGPDFQPPADDLPVHWASAEGRLEAQGWQRFGDVQLNQLMARAVRSNLDVRLASVRVLQARAARQGVAAERYPSVDVGGSYSRARNSAKGLSDPSGRDGKSAYDYWDAGLSAAWELDLWGRVRRQVEAADATVWLAEDERRGVLVSLLADVADDYIELRQVQQTLTVTRDNLGIAEHSLRLSRQRLADGVATRLDVAQGEAQVAVIAARVPPLEQRQGDLLDALALLLAAPPGTLANELGSVRSIPQASGELALGLPSELARRRPDIRQAEARLRAATAAIGVAKADFYPCIRLTGDLGLQALQLSQFGSWDARRVAFGPVLNLPLFEGGRLHATLDLREAQQQEAALAYRKTVLSAWHEIDQLLRRYQASLARRTHLDEAVRQSQLALNTAQRQYVEGAVDFLNVLSLQAQLLASQEQSLAATAETSEARVALYRALGGGWEAFEPVVADLSVTQPEDKR